MSAVLDKETCQRRMRRLYKEWKEPSSTHDLTLARLNCFVVAVGTDEEMIYSKTSSLQLWLLGYELSDTIALFTHDCIYFLASKKKLDFLKGLEACKGEGIPDIKFLARDRSDKDRKNFEILIEYIKSAVKDNKIGAFTREVFGGEFCQTWCATLKKENFEHVDISGAMAYIMCVKEENEITLIRKAAVATTDLFNKYLKDQIMNIIDADKKVKHNKISASMDEAMVNPKFVTNVDTALLEMCYPPIIQSGGNYNLKYSALSDKNHLHFGVILCSLGMRYRQYCSNLSRTLLVNPNQDIENTYNILLSIEEKLYNLLRPDIKLCDVYDKMISYVKEEHPALLDNLHKSFGFATGIEFRENTISITSKCQVVLKKNMVFNLHVGLTNLINPEATDEQFKSYALFVGDTVVINETTPPTPMTVCKKRIKNVGIFIKGDSSTEAESEEEVKEVPTTNLLGRSKRNAVLDNKLRQETNTEEKRRQHQKELALRVNEKARERIAKQGEAKEVEKVRRNTVSYKSINQIPREPEVKDLKLFVDKRHESVIMPIFGLPVPFHISTIKNISQSVEGEYTYLRINFFHPGATMGRNEGGIFPQPEATFVKELTYRASNVKEYGEAVPASNNLNNVFRLIKEVQKRFKMREAEEREKEDLVKQDTLIVSVNKSNPKIKDLYIRPNIVSKRMTGTLEAHNNGFRYTSVRGDKVDILYNNIKSAFFQPCDGEMIILLHFHLKHAILFGKKKHLDVQFYTEVGEITTDLGKHQHMHDRDDLAAEQAERELRHKLKSAFKGFCEKVENMTRQQIEFDTPFRELGFPGAPYRSTVTLQPTSGSLVNLTEWPPFVITLDDVELVHFERVQFHLRNFDMVFVFKDYSQKVAAVNAIPMNLLDHVKEWLNSCDIRYTEGVQSLNWAKIMKTITDDPEGFFEQGGWSFLDPESESEGENESVESEEDEAYQPTDVETEEESDEDDSEFSEASEYESEDSEDLGSDEESGKDWSDLEREAAEEDRKEELNIPDKHNGAHKKHTVKRMGRQTNQHNNRQRYDQGLSNGNVKSGSEKKRDGHHKEKLNNKSKSNHKRSHDDSGHSGHKSKKSRH